MAKGKTKTKTLKQVRFLMSKGSPLTTKQMAKLRREMHSGKVKIVKKKSGKKKKKGKGR